MKKLTLLAMAATSVLATAPAAAQSWGGYDRAYRSDGRYDRYDRSDRYDRYDRYGRYGNRSATDRNGDGFDDRDLNRDHWIDAREARRAGGTGVGSVTDRNGDGYDDRDRNRDGWIDAREARAGSRYWR